MQLPVLKNRFFYFLLIGLSASLPIHAQNFLYKTETQQLDSSAFNERYDSIFHASHNRSYRKGVFTVTYYVKKQNTSGDAKLRYGIIEISGDSAVETYFVRPKIVNPFADVPVYVDSIERQSRTIPVQKSIIKTIAKCDKNEGYFIQFVKADGKKIMVENNFLFITLNKDGRDILSVANYGIKLIDYDKILTRDNRPLENVLTWALDFYGH